jgi:regulator of sirC expression with transglutaminase-like and TPR domain
MRFIHVLVLLLVVRLPIEAAEERASPKLKALYSSLDPYSLAQHLAFYELYPDSQEGQEALRYGGLLLQGDSVSYKADVGQALLSSDAIKGLVALVNKQPDQPMLSLGEKQLEEMSRLTARLPNRKLKGYLAKTESEVLALPPEEIDLARGLFLTQLGEADLLKIRSYEASLDFMALQILARLPKAASPEVKIRLMNDFIFEEMGFRFPPHSLYAKDIDLYTFLPSVLDSRRGVCLGVSILYICLAQRLDLSLEMITPPGHIYVRYCDPERTINIETTARGIHIDSEEYLGVETRSLQQRTIKEVIGLAHFNQASVYWGEEKYEEALRCYAKARPYLLDDKLLTELMGYNYILSGNLEEGKKMLEEVRGYLPEHAVTRQTVAEDYLEGKVDAAGLKAIFMQVDEERESILKKRDALRESLKSFPLFRAGWFALAGAWLQLHRQGEALETLRHYETLDSTDPTAEYYLAVLHAERLDFNAAWGHFRRAEAILQSRQHESKALRSLGRALNSHSPE